MKALDFLMKGLLSNTQGQRVEHSVGGVEAGANESEKSERRPWSRSSPWK